MPTDPPNENANSDVATAVVNPKLAIDISDSAEVMKIKKDLNYLAVSILGIRAIGERAINDVSFMPLFKIKLDRAERAWTYFCEKWRSLDHSQDINFPSDEEQAFHDIVEEELEYSLAIMEGAKSSEPPKSNNTLGNMSSIFRPSHLPKMTVPEFDGSLMKWKSFHDAFVAVIHNDPSLSNIEKFNFLSQALKKDAHSFIAHITPSNEAYELAWLRLCQYFNNPRVLGSFYVSKALDFPGIRSKPSVEGYQEFLSGVADNLEAFESMKIKNPTDFIFSLIALRGLDSQSRREFELAHLDSDCPSFKDVCDFVRNRIKAIRLSGETDIKASSPKIHTSFPSRSSKKFSSSGSSFHTAKTSSSASSSLPTQSKPLKRKCAFCEGNHFIGFCPKFKGISISKRKEFIAAWKGCVNCLREGHTDKDCSSQFKCRTCNSKHHFLLHEDPPATSEPTSSKAEVGGRTFHSVGLTPSPAKQVLLGTAQVIIKSCSGRVIMARAMLDSCSQYTFIDTSLANKLGCEINQFRGSVSGLGGVDLNKPTGSTKCIVVGGQTEFPVNAVVVKNITSAVPSAPIPCPVVEELMDRHDLADPYFGKVLPVNILIGGDLYPRLLTGAPQTTSVPEIYLLPTVFGQVALGKAEADGPIDSATSMFVSERSNLDYIVRRFWEIEEPTPVSQKNPMDDYCERHFEETTYRNEKGQLVVSYPVDPNAEQLGTNRKVAEKRFFNLEKKFIRDPEFKEHYSKFMTEYIELGHMVPATESADYIVPHHGIWQVSSSGKKKLRTVFDASCPAEPAEPGGKSLSVNDILLPGPKVQSDLSDILLRFRTFLIALTTDIIKFYRSFPLASSQRKLQHILWREDPSEPLQEWELCTLTYGFRPSAFVSIKGRQKAALDVASKFPLAFARSEDSWYVDDFVSGADSIEEAQQLRRELIEMYSHSELHLDKWASNSPEVVPPKDSCDLPLSFNDSENPSVKILGLVWDPATDLFSYSVSSPSNQATKRAVLSSLAAIFDPIGLLSPVVFLAKCLIQLMWKEKLGWDEELPDRLRKKWDLLREEWNLLKNINVPRLVTSPQHLDRMIIGFCDASQAGYAAAIYLRSVNPQGDTRVFLIKSKTKVAPLRFTSVARLELNAALLLARIISSIKLPGVDVSNCYLFTDSMVVLAWLRLPVYQLKTYEANRVSAILEVTDLNRWYHVRSAENAADLASRGLMPSELSKADLWWHGPNWLKRPPNEWPIVQCERPPVWMREVRHAFVTYETNAKKEENIMLSFFSRFSKFTLLVKVVARFMRLGNQPEDPSFPLTAEELKKATDRCVLIAQKLLLPYDDFTSQKKIPRELSELNPFVDEHGLILVGGRLHEAPIPSSQRHPALLPRTSHLSKLIVEDIHNKNFHAGPTLTLALVRKRFWILGGLRFVKGVISRCVRCRIHTAKPVQPLMGNLPKERFSQHRAFLHTGVDFAGPFLIKESNRRKSPRKQEFLQKAYLCIFICLSSRAVHLECVTALTTVAFLAALDRFVARRNSPLSIHSDNGTNFVGASRYLKDVSSFLRSHHKELVEQLALREIDWHFSPPRAPHFGGSWESGVKSVKSLLSRTVGPQPFTFEELQTIFVKIEGILNSRPLCPLTEDANSWDYLTPGHFLVGAPIRPLPQLVEEQPSNPLQRWEKVKSQVESIWRRWRLEYLHHLQQRRKWKDGCANIKKGDLVIMIEKRHLLGQWPVARVVDVHPGSDSIVRVISVKVPSGSVFKRSVTSVAPLFYPDHDYSPNVNLSGGVSDKHPISSSNSS